MLVFGIIGAIFSVLDFPVAPILLGYVLGPMVEENFRRSLLLSRGDMTVFLTHPISACFIAVSAILVLVQLVLAMRAAHGRRRASASAGKLAELDQTTAVAISD